MDRGVTASKARDLANHRTVRMKDATRVVRAGLPEVKQGEAFLPGPTFAGTYHFSGDRPAPH